MCVAAAERVCVYAGLGIGGHILQVFRFVSVASFTQRWGAVTRRRFGGSLV